MSFTVQTQAELLAAFADSDPAGAITPQVMRNFVGSVPIIASGVGFGLVATGNALPTALPLTQLWNYFKTVAAGTGCLLLSSGEFVGVEMILWNAGLNNLTVYPQPGDFIGVVGNAFASTYLLGASAKVRLGSLAPGYWIVSGT